MIILEIFSNLVNYFNYYFTLVLLCIGLYSTINSTNLVRRLFMLSIFQGTIVFFYISLAFAPGGRLPILKNFTGMYIYNAALPHVLMLTAIVVGVATLSVGLGLVIRIKRENKTLDIGNLSSYMISTIK